MIDNLRCAIGTKRRAQLVSLIFLLAAALLMPLMVFLCVALMPLAFLLGVLGMSLSLFSMCMDAAEKGRERESALLAAFGLLFFAAFIGVLIFMASAFGGDLLSLGQSMVDRVLGWFKL